MNRPPFTRIDADATRGVLQDDTLRPRAEIVGLQIAHCFGLRTIQSLPPYQHIVPVLALAQAAAGIALLFGDPALIDVVAEEARSLLRDGRVTIQDIFGRNDT